MRIDGARLAQQAGHPLQAGQSIEFEKALGLVYSAIGRRATTNRKCIHGSEDCVRANLDWQIQTHVLP
ncbi:MAG: hypothetical protein VXZ82_16305 [Planctomycetota bacterium]|nr:hypothetical protein [Planctomycetota bacterium]